MHLSEAFLLKLPLDDHDMDGSYEDSVQVDLLDNSILKYPALSGPDRTAYDVPELKHSTSSTHVVSPLYLEGVWSGTCSFSAGINTCGLMEIAFKTDAGNGTLTGSGIDAIGTFEISGKYRHNYSFEFTFARQGPTDHTSILPNYCIGKRDPVSRAITGEWGTKNGVNLGLLNMDPIPAKLYSLLHPLNMPVVTVARARWWWAIINVTRHLRPWYYCKQQLATRRRYMELYRRHYISDSMDDAEIQELVDYENTMLPADIRFLRSVARSRFNICIHL